MLVARMVALLVRKSRSIVTGTGCPGGVVTLRHIDRSRGWIAWTVGRYSLIDIVGPVERLRYVTGKCGEPTYLARHHTYG